ncbi:hypothetical protein ABBQ32_002039 [Trebouxia sp. C0010 RCD-2024]
MKPAEEEEDVLDALGTLASFASQEQRFQEGDEANEAMDEDDDDQPFTRKPFTRTMQKQERDALQKWVQCAKCAKWRKVPYTLKDEDISEDWECKDNKWDRTYAACTMAQALTDEEIDGILAGQEASLEARPLPPVEPETADADIAENPQLEGSKQIANRSRPTRNKTKKVIGGATDEEIAEHAARPRMPRPAAMRQLQRNRSKGKNGKMRVGSKHINEAAEALLGMGSGFVDDDNMVDDDGEEMGDEGELGFSPGSFRPGKVVWAKVDGHEWWPAKVVRRRAVPREVGPPPGGPALVHTQIPVVFFTQSGVPGEATEVAASSQDLAAVCSQAIDHIGDDSKLDSDEAEYAWLSLDSLKPFREGDSLTAEDETHVSDPTLTACIAAAERAVKAAADRAAAADDAEPEGEEEDGAESLSDSDGGWGYTHTDALGTPRAKGRHRPAKPRKGRAVKGNKRAKGKSGRAGWEDDEDVNGNEAPLVDPYGRVPGVPLPAPVVEGLYGWRWPQFPQELARQTGQYHEQEGQEAAASHDMGQAKVEPADDSLAHASTQHDGLQQEEADAVAALLAAASGLSSEDMHTSSHYPAGLERDAEYLVKWIGKAHIHNEWVPEPLLMRIAKRKVINFKRRYGSQPCMLMEQAWTQPCAFICRRPCLSGPGWEMLVKWCNLGYEHATWEVEGEGPLAHSQNPQLHRQLLQRQREALLRSHPEAAEAAAAAKGAASKQLTKLEEQPEWIRQGQLYPHQLEAINWLRQRWVQGMNAVLADDQGLGRTATVITFLQCLRHEFHSPRPVLLATQGSELKMWEGELEFWGAQGLHVVVYNGSAAARTVIAEHELWLAPGCLDGRAPKRLTADMPHKVVQPDVVLASFDALASDISHLQPIDWEAVVVDERCKVQSNLAKAHQALRDVESNFRLLLPSGNPTLASYDSLVQSLYYLDPEAVPDQDLDAPSQQHHEQDMRQAIGAYMLRRLRSQVSTFSPPTSEVVLPVMMTQQQRECYKAQLARAYEILTDPKTPRQNSYRGGQLRMVCSSLKKVCDHPCLVPDYESAGSQGSLAASGKLVVLDKLLHHLQAHAHKTLLLSHHPQVLEMLAAHCRQNIPDLVVEHIEGSASAAARHDAIKRFNACSSAGVVLMSTKSCGLGTNLPSITAVVLHDSDWNPRWDMQALSRAHHIGQADKAVPVYRLVTKGTLEERVHQLADKKKGSDLVFKSSISKASPAAVHIMEGALRWGVEHIFSHQHYITEHSQGTPAATPSPNARDHDLKMEDAASPQGPSHPAREAGTAGAEATPSPRRRTTPASASPEPGMQSPFGAPEQQQQPKSHSKPRNRNSGSVFQPVYTDTVLEKVLEWSMALSRAAKAWAHGSEGVNDDKASSGVGGAAQSLGEVLGADWSCVKLHEWSQSQLDDDTQADEGDDDDARTDLECAELDLGDETLSRSEHSGSNAKFWEGLLKERHQQLLKEEEQQVREQWRSHHLHSADVSPALNPAEEAIGHDYNDEAEEEEGLGTRQSSGMTHLPDFGGDDAEGNRSRKRRPVKAGSGRAVAKGNRRRRLDEEDEQAEEMRVNRKRKRGVHHDSGRLAVGRADYEAELREQQHLDDVMRRLADPSTPEGMVAQKAYRRITELLEELKLDEGHLDFATQAPQILMVLRPETEPISDFQDYTLVAVIAVASHLRGSHTGDHHFLAALAQRFSQDPTALYQVFEYIMATMARYREGHNRRTAALADHTVSHRTHSAGLLDAPLHQGGDSLIVRVDSDQAPSRRGSADHHHAVAQPPSVIMNSDMEAFGNRLSAIVNADFYAAALAVGPVDVPLGPLQALSAHLPADNSAQAQHTEEILKQLRQMQEQVALFDRIHNIRVKHIQEEYQKYMERVRSKAQSAIDQANANYQHHRAMLTARVDTMVHYLQQQYLRGPANTYQDADRLLQQQRQQLEQHCAMDVDGVREGTVPSPPAAAVLAEPVAGPATSFSQDLTDGQTEGNQPKASASAEQAPNQLADVPLQHPSRPQDADTATASHGPTTSASGMSLQPPSLPSQFLHQQQQQQGMPAQPVSGSAQAQQQQAAVAAAVAAGSPREAGQLGIAGQKQAPKPPLAPGSKGVPQPMLLARHLKQPTQHLPLKGLSPQQQSQVLSQYNHDQQRATAPLSTMRRAGPVVLAGHPTRGEAPAQTVHAIFQQGGLQQAVPKSKLGSGGPSTNPTPLASLVTSQAHPHSYPHGYPTVQSGAPSMVPPTHPKPIQTGPAGDSFPSRQTSSQVKAAREVSPSTEIRINGDPGHSSAQQTSSAGGGAASYGASTMGITIQPSQPAPPAEDDSMGDSSPSHSGSPAREGAANAALAHEQAQQAQQSPVEAFVAALPKQHAVMSSHRVSMLRGGPVAGAYIDGRQVTTGSGELPAHIAPHPIGYDQEDRFGRGSARKAEASRYAALSSSNKPDSSSARSMHASPTRLIITSGGGPSRDSPAVHAVSGDLLRADSEPNRAQHAPSISLVTAPNLSQTPTSERPLQAATPSHHQAAEQPSGSMSDAALGPNTAASPSLSQAHAEAQQASLYRQQAAAGSPQQQATSSAGQTHPPFASRVDSLSHWARQGDAQQRSSSLQSDAVSGHQAGRVELQQRQKFPAPVSASQGGLTSQEQQQLLLKQQQRFQQAHTEQHRVSDQES